MSLHRLATLGLIGTIVGLGSAALGMFLDWDQRFAWFDEALHAFLGFMLALTIMASVRLARVRPLLRTVGSEWVFVVGAVLILGLLWEGAQWVTDRLAGTQLIPSATDTLTDVLLDTLGAAIGASLGSWLAQLHEVRQEPASHDRSSIAT